MNFILILVLIAVAIIAIRKTLKASKAEQQAQNTERMNEFRKTMRDLYRR